MKVALKTFEKELENAWYCCFDLCAYGDAPACIIHIKYEHLGVDEECEPIWGEPVKIQFIRLDNNELFLSIDYKMLNDENIEYDNGRYEICNSDIPPFYLLGVMKLN